MFYTQMWMLKGMGVLGKNKVKFIHIYIHIFVYKKLKILPNYDVNCETQGKVLWSYCNIKINFNRGVHQYNYSLPITTVQ